MLRCSVLVATVVMALPSVVVAIELPPEKCGADKPPLIMEPGDVIVKSWCNLYEEAAVLTSPGTMQEVAGSTASCENCSDNCGNPELPQPRELTCKLTLQTSYKNAKSLTVTGGVSGGSDWIAKIEASLEIESGYKETTQETVSVAAEVTVGPCEWQDTRAFLKASVGRTAQMEIVCQPCWLIRHVSYTPGFEYHGAPLKGMATLKCSMSLAGSASIKTVANGRCPRR